VEAEAYSEAFDFLRSRKRKHFSLNMGQGCGSGYIFVEAEALWKKKLEAEANSEATNFMRSWKRKQKIFYCFRIPGIIYALIDSNVQLNFLRFCKICAEKIKNLTEIRLNHRVVSLLLWQRLLISTTWFYELLLKKIKSSLYSLNTLF